MKNSEIADIFRDIAALLKKRKDNIFKIRAYEKAADYIQEWPEEMAELVKGDRLGEIPGVGEAISKKIVELVTSGSLEYYERLKEELTEVNNAPN